ncbi:MAG TPA: M15 family metallopeptidase [Chitinophagaceae bacterium]|nr:M15 family metallopeptidase [Chitinophagaceae bacterium]
MNLLKQRHFLLTVQTIFVYIVGFTQNPALPLSKYGVPVLSDVKFYQSTVISDSNKQMTDLKTFIPNLVLDIRYAGNNNFMRRNMYPGRTNTTYLRLPVAKALAQVQKELNERGLGLKLFDAYRPYSVTEKFWELVMNEKYVADPKKGSGHNRGTAVDVTIINLQTKAELPMPTGFDNFTDTAHQTFMQLPFSLLENRKMLKDIMEKHGFKPLETEWWHFSWANDQNFEILDLPFSTFKKN